MPFNNKAWLTLYQSEFQRDSYLYHYTSIEKAVTILDSNSLRFSKITATNDTLEAKPKMSYRNIYANDELNEIVNEISRINRNYIQLLCFSKDSEIDKATNNQRVYLSDYSGRGFALPRMWAQYAHNNDGICFVFDKLKLLGLIHQKLNGNLICENNIEYVSQYTSFNFNYVESLQFLLERTSNFNKAYAFAEFLKGNKEYTNYNYFYKLDDWSNENEFRILAYGDDNLFIKNISNALVGVVIGEQIKPTNEKIIKFFCKNICEIKKIEFSYNGCTLDNIYED